MRLDTANRSFATLLGASLLAGMFALCGAAGCVLVLLVVVEITRHGLGALSSDAGTLWPAVTFIAIVGGGALAGICSLVRQARASRHLEGRVRELAAPLPGPLARAANAAGMTGRVLLVDSPERFSFVYGALQPRVAVSRGLIEAASDDEVGAVLEHERYHVRNLDPLKVFLARALPAAFFYLPAFRGLESRYVAGRELAADRRAVEKSGRKSLAGALFKVVRGPSWPELDTAAAIGGPELLNIRLAQLESGVEPNVSGPSRAALATSLLGATALTILFVVSVAEFGGPSAVADATGAQFRLLDLAGAVLCAAPWAAAGWLGYRWLARRARRPLDTTAP